jgi:hypothetical protein
MPSSVLLAILVGAGVLALMPALVRRYDSASRSHVELQSSSMRVLIRRRRKRTVPGSAPIRPPSFIRRPADGRIIGRATVADALTPGDAESDALVRAALRAPAPTTSAAVSASALAAAAATDHTRPVRTVRRSMVDEAHLRQWRRFQRRRILVAFALLFTGQTAGALVIGPVFWAGVGVSAVLMLAYLVRLRATAAAEARQLAAERARRRRAYEFVRVATRHTKTDHAAVSRAAAWLSTPREARRRPPREVVRVLALAGREVLQSADGSWVVRRAPEQVAQPRRPLLPRTARSVRPAAAAVAEDPDTTLPRAVNS